ncbi:MULTISPECIES: DUF3955 domain-containing protein [Pseudovibrio]|uniref:DUF3955 domain-containing protein n=1 Tax=Stappiaceae TaxID=2821832 RepID=UPI002365DC47|nr:MULTISPECIES: DUF3955 domain-containing protein [Pseudovibrio]MDD7910839.1 DUF3955 domain-containing protein [Pseudovibrio exalbescens]MDX5593452.1 DUF3955 domain-containing protein [Pseudovibrio sp. SPO723]
MTKTQIVFVILTLIGVGCVVAFQMIGSTVDENGLLREPFFLIPMGYLFLAAGLGGLVIMALKRGLRRLTK